MECRLCLLDKTLVKKSHIIPNFMYKGILDKENTMVKLNINNPKLNKINRSGVYEGGLLCQQCESLLSKYESYASDVFYGSKVTARVNLTYKFLSEHLLKINNIDYLKMKLFFISILWRCHISKDEAFKNVNLGKIAEKIRLMVLNGIPGNAKEYEIKIIIYQIPEIPSKSMIPPKKINLSPIEYHLIHINDMSIFINTSNKIDNDYFKSAGLYENNTLVLYIGKDSKAKELFQKTTGIKFEI